MNTINATQFEQNNSVQCSEYNLIPRDTKVANLTTEFQLAFKLCIFVILFMAKIMCFPAAVVFC